MFTGVQFTHFIQANPALAVFLTVALGFLLGKLRIRSFSLGTVTSVLLVGVIVGQLRIEIPEPAKTLFFLMFLFAVGYAVGPQFFRGLKKDGLPQVAFAVVVCLLCLGSVWLFSWLMGYTLSQAAGLLGRRRCRPCWAWRPIRSANCRAERKPISVQCPFVMR